MQLTPSAPMTPENSGRKTSLLARTYATWMVLALTIQLLGYADTRSVRDLFTILAETAVSVALLCAWVFRTQVADSLGRIRIHGITRFVLVGLIAAYVSESFFYVAIASPIPRPVFMLRTLVWYVGWFGAWWWLCHRHSFSRLHVFFLGGLNGFLVESLLLRAVPLTPLGLFLYPLVASLYGAMLLIPFLVSEDHGPPRDIAGSTRFGLSLLPLLAFVPGFLWMALVHVVFGASA